MRINITTIENENALSEVKTSAANGIVGGDGVTINYKIDLQDGGPGAANAGISAFNFTAVTTDIDAGNSLDGRPFHQANLSLSGSLGD